MESNPRPRRSMRARAPSRDSPITVGTLIITGVGVAVITGAFAVDRERAATDGVALINAADDFLGASPPSGNVVRAASVSPIRTASPAAHLSVLRCPRRAEGIVAAVEGEALSPVRRLERAVRS